MHTSLLLFLNRYKQQLLLAFILLLGLYFRTFNINWDSNYYFHPDERAIIMFTLDLHSPSSVEEFLSPQSPLNPNFFAYGTFPIYLLKAVTILFSSINPILHTYGGMHLVGRPLSALFDTATIFLIFLLTRRLFSNRTGFFAAFFYSVAVLPIQLSHFYAVDTILTFFITASLLVFIEFLIRPTRLLGILLGVSIGLSLATKVSALILGPVMAFPLFALLTSLPRKKLPSVLMHLVVAGVISCLVFVITQPYVIIDIREFLQQTSLQTQMSRNPYLFPYTLQYVNKTPYLYELTNIYLWGLGPVVASLSFAGFIAYLINYLKKGGKTYKTVPLVFIGIYFLVFGGFAVGYMRYMLPLYPFLALTAAYLVSEVIIPHIPTSYFSFPLKRKGALLIFASICLLYPVSFISIYKTPNTRIEATEWILENIPSGSVIATEHWDDALPLKGGEKYNVLQLPLYEKDTTAKWERIHRQLHEVDYIILASHRLYVPLQKLGDCNNVQPTYCYPLTKRYYEDLFNGTLGFKKVAEFSSQPKLPFLPVYINDFHSDENFTVFDHPKVLIFQKQH